MRIEGSCVIGGATNQAGVPVPTTARPSGRDVLTDMARAHARRQPVIVLGPEPQTPARPAPATGARRHVRGTGDGPKWTTDHDKARIIQAYRAGRTIREIADELGRYTTTIRRVIDQAGIPKRDDRGRTSQAIKAQAVLDVAAGQSVRGVARRLGVHDSTVHTWLNAAKAREQGAA